MLWKTALGSAINDPITSLVTSCEKATLATHNLFKISLLFFKSYM